LGPWRRSAQGSICGFLRFCCYKWHLRVVRAAKPTDNRIFGPHPSLPPHPPFPPHPPGLHAHYSQRCSQFNARWTSPRASNYD